MFYYLALLLPRQVLREHDAGGRRARLDDGVEARPDAVERTGVLTGPAERIEIVIAGATVRVPGKPIGWAIDVSAKRRVIARCPGPSHCAGKFGGQGGIGDYIAKPKGMHRRTFDRVMEKIYRAEEIVDAHTDLLLDRLMKRSSAVTLT